MRLSVILDLWDRFWFAKVSPYPMAAYRILHGLMVTQFAILLWPTLYIFYGVDGIVSQQGVYADTSNKLNILTALPENPVSLTILYYTLIASALCFTIGFKTRLAAFVIFFIMVSLTSRNGFHLNSGDTFLRTMCFWFVFAPSGEVWSIDSYLKNRTNSAQPYCPLISAWMMRALQLQVCLVYFSAFTAKTPGWYWASGEAVYIASRFETLQRMPLPIPWDNFWVTAFFTWGTLMVEFSMFTLVWVKELRYYVLACALCLHFTIDWIMCIPQFEWLMIFSYILFLSTSDLLKSYELCKCFLARSFPKVRPKEA